MRTVAAFVLSLYIGYAVYVVFPFTRTISFGSSATARNLTGLVLFLVFVAVATFITQKITRSVYLRFGNGAIAILVVLILGFLLALGYHSFSLDSLFNLPPVVKMIFEPSQFFFWWFIAPLVALLLLVL